MDEIIKSALCGENDAHVNIGHIRAHEEITNYLTFEHGKRT